jgi:uncharacterized protein YuzE
MAGMQAALAEIGREGPSGRLFRGDRVLDRPREGRHCAMAERIVKMWFDPEADFLEVVFEQKPGYSRPTENDQVMERVDEKGNVISFSILHVSSLKKLPLEVALR